MNYIRVTKENIDKEHICCAMLLITKLIVNTVSKLNCTHN